MEDEAKTKEALIEELRQLRENLLTAERNYRALFTTNSDAIMIFDFETSYGIEQNPRARKLFGYSESEFQRLKNRDMVPPERRAEVAMLSAQVYAMGRARRPRMRLRRKDGSEFWGDISLSVFDVDGHKRMIKIVRDVTPSVEHEARLRQQKELLQTVFDHIPVMIILFDKCATASFINRETEVVLGWSLEEWQSLNVLSECYPDESVRRQFLDLLAQAPSRWLDFQTRNRYGRVMETTWYHVKLPSGGALSIGQDITERRVAEREVHALEDRLRQKQKLEALGTLAAGVAHEINNPLTWIMGNIEYLQELLVDYERRMPMEFTSESIQVVAEMLDGTERIRKIVTGLEPFARMDDEEFGPVDLSDVLLSSVNIAQTEIRHRATLVRRTDHAPLVYGNSTRLTQVFVNLLLNAAQATPHGNTEVNEIRIMVNRRVDSRVCVSVEDTGAGIEPHVMSRIFEPFFTTSAPERTGLGLAMCHSIVESCGGEIEVESTPGKGTVVRVILQIATQPPRRSDTYPPVLLGPPARILVVDDEPNVCHTICRALRGHQLTEALGGREALEHMASDTYDVVLCDVMMPDVSGVEVYEHIRSHQPGMEQRIVFMTGGAFTDDAREFLERVENRVLYKPLDTTELRNIVRKMAPLQGASKS